MNQILIEGALFNLVETQRDTYIEEILREGLEPLRVMRHALNINGRSYVPVPLGKIADEKMVNGSESWRKEFRDWRVRFKAETGEEPGGEDIEQWFDYFVFHPMAIAVKVREANYQNALDGWTKAMEKCREAKAVAGQLNELRGEGNGLVVYVKHRCPDMIEPEDLQNIYHGDAMRAWMDISNGGKDHPMTMTDDYEVVSVRPY